MFLTAILRQLLIKMRQQQGIGRKNENEYPVRKWYICSSIITLMFDLNMNFG